MHPDLKAVFWDFGGVLTESPFDAFARFEQQQGLPADFLRETNAVKPHTNAWACLARGEVDAETFDRRFHEETAARGHPVRGRELLPLLAGAVRPAMVRVLQAVRGHYAVACLTNNSPSGTGAGMSRDPEHARAVQAVMDEFDFLLESSRAGVRKPETAFYEHACARAGVSPASVVFLDDLGVNLKPARQLGMHTIKVQAPEQAVSELARLLGLPLLPVYRGDDAPAGAQ